MNVPNTNAEAKKLKQPTWQVNLGIGLATGIILGMLIASWGLRQENWQKAGLETDAAIMLVIVFVISALVAFGTAFVRNGFRCSRWAIVIAISILSVALLGIVLFLEPTSVQRASMAKLTAAGAKFSYVPGDESGLEIVLGEQYFRDVVSVDFDYRKTPNPDLTCLQGLSALKYIDLLGIKCPPTDLEPIKALPCLTNLWLNECQLSEKSWECIGKINSLNGLSLYLTPVRDSELKYLANLTNLRYLNLSETLITNDGLAYLKNMSNLQHLFLVKTNITDQGLNNLGGLTKLKVLDLRGTQVTDEGVEALQQLLPNCDIKR
jgi:hypothetical protein